LSFGSKSRSSASSASILHEGISSDDGSLPLPLPVSEGETVDQPDCAEVEVVEKREEMDEVER
jgi:hypothetical protein